MDFGKCIEFISTIMVYFHEQKFLILMKFSLSIVFLFWFMLSVSYLKVFA